MASHSKTFRSVISFLSLSLLIFGISVWSGCTKKQSAGGCPSGVSDVSDLKSEDLKPGDGKAAEAGKMVSVHYTGWLTNCQKFDSSKDRKEPFRFPLGGGRVIKGWDQGVAGMKVGGVRRLTIPPTLGYGERGAGQVIPPNATLIFEVELLSVEE